MKDGTDTIERDWTKVVNEAKEKHPLVCSFCGKTQREVKNLIAGPQVFICDECIGLCNELLACGGGA